MNPIKRFIKSNSRNILLGIAANLGRSINKLYENRNHDIHSNGEKMLLKKISKLNPSTIFDVGANKGSYTELVKRYCPEAEIHCFEPVEETFEKLKIFTKNFNKVILNNAGLYSEETSLLINKYPSHTHASIYPIQHVHYQKTGEEKINLMSGDFYLKSKHINTLDLLKLDVEGSELEVLKGFNNTLNQRKIRIIQFEYGYINIITKNLLIDYYELLESKGYIIGKLYPKTVAFRTYQYKYEDFIGPNMIAVHRDDRELIKILSR